MDLDERDEQEEMGENESELVDMVHERLAAADLLPVAVSVELLHLSAVVWVMVVILLLVVVSL